ncbi:leucine-rich repeat domain-containing protein [Lachnospiraceae bacterium JLR.KK008]
MKIVEITCPSCGARLSPPSVQTRLMTCEYCGNQFLLDDERTQNITNYNIYQGFPASPPNQGRPIRVYQDPTQKDRGNLRVVVGICTMAVSLLLLLFILSSALRFRPNTSVYDETTTPYSYDDDPLEEETYVAATPNCELYQAMIEEMFGKSTGVTAQELARVKYLKVQVSHEGDKVWYSFDDPYGEAPDIRVASFPNLEWNVSDTANFTGLVLLDASYGLPSDMDLSGFDQLKGIIVNGTPLSQIAEMVDPEQITELRLSNIDSMEGIHSFVNLERLSVVDMPDTNLKLLVSLKKLKELSLEDTVRSDSISVGEEIVRVTDYSAIAVMTNLESLSLSSDLIRDVGFLKGLPNLRAFSMEDSAVISLEPLAELPGLQSLHLADNYEIKDYGPIGQMTGLTELSVDKMTSDADPDLSSLTKLEKVELCGFMSVGSLRGHSNIRELTIHNCNIDGMDALSTLTGVERLTMYAVWQSHGLYITNLNFLDGMKNLKYADLNGNLDGSGWSGYNYGVEVYGDISSVFNHPSLEELYLDDSTCEINFDRIGENSTLRVLSLRSADLNKNFYVEDYGGILNAWYDEVALVDHLDFLAKFPNLEELYLDSNELTDLEFTRNLKKLTRLSVKDNYITDLSPLTQAEYLTYLNISENPVGEWDGADEKVEIVQ